MVREIGRRREAGDGSVFDVVELPLQLERHLRLVPSVAVLAGKTAYEPMLFWFGLAGLVAGRPDPLTAKPSGAA